MASFALESPSKQSSGYLSYRAASPSRLPDAAQQVLESTPWSTINELNALHRSITAIAATDSFASANSSSLGAVNFSDLQASQSAKCSSSASVADPSSSFADGRSPPPKRRPFSARPSTGRLSYHRPGPALSNALASLQANSDAASNRRTKEEDAQSRDLAKQWTEAKHRAKAEDEAEAITALQEADKSERCGRKLVEGRSKEAERKEREARDDERRAVVLAKKKIDKDKKRAEEEDAKARLEERRIDEEFRREQKGREAQQRREDVAKRAEFRKQSDKAVLAEKAALAKIAEEEREREVAYRREMEKAEKEKRRIWKDLSRGGKGCSLLDIPFGSSRS